MKEAIKGYKGFNKGLVCKGKQYAVGEVFEAPKAEICRCGIHFCLHPADVLDYYPLIADDGTPNEFCEVEALGTVATYGNKSVTTKLKVVCKLSLEEFIEIIKRDRDAASGNESKLAASGDWSKLAASGDWSQLAASGDNCVVCGIGVANQAKASVGSWIVLAEYDSNGHVTCVKSKRVDGERIKADTYYTLVDGEFKEV